MVELLQLIEAGLTFTAVAIVVAAVPVTILTGEPLPNVIPVVESMVNNDIPESIEK